SRELPFKVKTTEAQHYRRYIIQQRLKSKNQSPFTASQDGWEKTIPGLLPINDGKGFVFVSHTGEVCPSGFLPVSAGNVRVDSLTHIYRNSPVLTSLRDTSNLQGKCGACEFKEICGGSRARAYAITENMFAEDPCCNYIPAALRPA
ncbi:MAG TPA: SPASM domain-containing protein, partial [Candidatus Angelobacter sp.]|nr:SPASM domain-containing protein [Candidatus Angelobacter sp.]